MDTVRNNNNCFNRERKLVSASQFRLVFQKNDKSSDRYWTILFRRNEEGYARLGMAVAKKRAKRAVDRNRLKRTIRESFRGQDKLPGIDIVVLPRDSSVNATSEQLRKSLDQQWSRIIKICAR
ncbi:ribonuclease P protein component [Chromatiales bacterium (ex Bugula neritina AB1)]|nr:ribonuclease P protein component [Chromatiales bacterium (ex Bugula neritina AB1)]